MGNLYDGYRMDWEYAHLQVKSSMTVIRKVGRRKDKVCWCPRWMGGCVSHDLNRQLHVANCSFTPSAALRW